MHLLSVTVSKKLQRQQKIRYNKNQPHQQVLDTPVTHQGFRHPGMYPKNPVGFFGYTHLKSPPQKTHTSTLT